MRINNDDLMNMSFEEFENSITTDLFTDANEEYRDFFNSLSNEELKEMCDAAFGNEAFLEKKAERLLTSALKDDSISTENFVTEIKNSKLFQMTVKVLNKLNPKNAIKAIRKLMPKPNGSMTENLSIASDKLVKDMKSKINLSTEKYDNIIDYINDLKLGYKVLFVFLIIVYGIGTFGLGAIVMLIVLNVFKDDIINDFNEFEDKYREIADVDAPFCMKRISTLKKLMKNKKEHPSITAVYIKEFGAQRNTLRNYHKFLTGGIHVDSEKNLSDNGSVLKQRLNTTKMRDRLKEEYSRFINEVEYFIKKEAVYDN